MTTKKPRVVGTSRGTPPLTDDDIERLADEAGAGYDPSQLRPRGGARMGSAPAEVVPGASRPGVRVVVEARVDRRARSYQHMWYDGAPYQGQCEGCTTTVWHVKDDA